LSILPSSIGTQRIVDYNGIVGNPYNPTWINDDTLTAYSGPLGIHVKGIHRSWSGSWWDSNSRDWYGGVIHINSTITNNGGMKVGVRVNGRIVAGSIGINSRHHRGFVFLRGNQSNTFTGDTEVMDGNVLILNKSNGATAIQGNIVVRRGGAVSLWQSNQIADTSTVTLDGRDGMAGFLFEMMAYEMTEKFHQLVVKSESRLLFHRKPNKRTLFLDDLLIEERGALYVGDWADGVTKLLVRKDSEHLSESLKRIVFDHDKTREVGLREYDKDYWEIGPGFPEPATYGAILVGIVGFVVRQRRKK